MKKKIFALCAGLTCVLLMSGCNNTQNTSSSISEKITSLTFSQNEYVVKSGDCITVNEHNDDVEYSFVKTAPGGVTLNKDTGMISFDESIPNYTQLLYKANYEDLESNFVVLTLKREYAKPTLTFLNPIDYVSDGDYILASNSEGLSTKYEIDRKYKGVSIDSTTGRVSFTSKVVDGYEFEVSISSNGAINTKTFKAAIDNLATVENNKQAAEKNGTTPVAFNLDFSNVNKEEYGHEFLGIIASKELADESDYTFNKEENQVILKPEYLNKFNPGEINIGIITSRNVINVTLLMATKFIRTAEDLASIGDNRETLKGYYIMINDIDLTNYLSSSGAGYNGGKGWNPIGVYHDVADGTAYLDTFAGTFDGAGHTVSGLFINRDDELAYNAGLFGYISNAGTVKNLGVVSRKNATWHVRSYSGGLCGFNAGKIENCWTDVKLSNYSGENVFKIIGGFVGRNEGTITNCYSLGNVDGDANVGSFAGFNAGIMTNCFSHKEVYQDLIGGGLTGDNCKNFENLDDLKGYEFSEFDSNFWEISSNSRPVLKKYLAFYFVFDLKIVNNINFVTRGKDYVVDVEIYPSNLYEKYKDQIQYSIVGEGFVLNGNVVDSTNATEYEFVVTVSLTADGNTFTDSITCTLYDKIESIDMSNIPTEVEVGATYQLKGSVNPSTAYPYLTYKLEPKKIYGVSLVEDMLTIDESAQVDSIKIYAQADGVKSKIVTIKLKKFTYLEQNIIFRKGEEMNELNFTLPAEANLDGLKVLVDNNEVEFTLNDHVVTLPTTYATDKPNKTVGFTFKTSDGGLYRSFATYIDHESKDISTIGEYITLSSKEDFYKYFDMVDYDPARKENYSKTYVLTADIDFGNDSVYSIGNDTLAFTGKIYGQGYSIKNAKLKESSTYWTLPEEDKTNQYRSSLYAYGFFGTFDGEIYDVNFDNIEVKGKNWIGCFACTVNTGIMENITFTNCYASSWGGVFANATYKSRPIAPTFFGTAIGVTYNYYYMEAMFGKGNL